MTPRCLYRRILLTGTVFLYAVVSFAQPIKFDENAPAKQFPFVSLVFNRIFNSSGLDTFYQKLYTLKKKKQGLVTIVHIGDSHVESGYLPDAVRKGFQDFFGAAGKEPAGPKQEIKTSAPVPSKFSTPFYPKDSTGVYYRAIGIKGARYETFTQSPAFWEQLASLHADLVIVSLGTNDAQASEFSETEFRQQVSLFMNNLKKASPAAALLFTTAADSFKGGYPNRELWNMNVSLFTYCSDNNIPVWDLYRVTNGFGSAYNWIKKGMMDADGIHFTGAAYKVQGQLLFNALALGYNNYVSQ